MYEYDFSDWSPAQLAHALGYRIDLRRTGGGLRAAWLIGPTGREHPTWHARACHTLARLARWRGIDPASAPNDSPRALLDGREQNLSE